MKIYDRWIIKYENSFDSFYARLDYPDWEKEVTHTEGETTDEMIDTVKFMINHGASLNYKEADEFENQNFMADTMYWVMKDGELSEKDEELLTLLAMHVK